MNWCNCDYFATQALKLSLSMVLQRYTLHSNTFKLPTHSPYGPFPYTHSSHNVNMHSLLLPFASKDLGYWESPPKFICAIWFWCHRSYIWHSNWVIFLGFVGVIANHKYIRHIFLTLYSISPWNFICHDLYYHMKDYMHAYMFSCIRVKSMYLDEHISVYIGVVHRHIHRFLAWHDSCVLHSYRKVGQLHNTCMLTYRRFFTHEFSIVMLV